MPAFFFYGTLCHAHLLEAVLDRPVGALDSRLASGTLAGHKVTWVADEPFPMIAPLPGAKAQGLVFLDVTEDEAAQLSYYEGAFAYHLVDVDVQTDAGAVRAVCFYPMSQDQTAGADWVLDDWVRVWGEMAIGAAKDVMARRARYDAEAAADLRPFMMARHWARHLGRAGTPTTVRRTPDEGDVSLLGRTGGYLGFFELAQFQFNHLRFDGSRSGTMTREAFVAFDAALVLPYDPSSDNVLLIEQLRFGPMWRDDPNPWVFEPIAGMVDAGEDPQDTARREAVEEAGLVLGPLEKMTQVYASPGYSTEFFHCFLAVTDLSSAISSHTGLAAENEDIRTHILPFDRAMQLVATGEINAGPLVMMLYWLAAHRARLQGAA